MGVGGGGGEGGGGEFYVNSAMILKIHL